MGWRVKKTQKGNWYCRHCDTIQNVAYLEKEYYYGDSYYLTPTCTQCGNDVYDALQELLRMQKELQAAVVQTLTELQRTLEDGINVHSNQSRSRS